MGLHRWTTSPLVTGAPVAAQSPETISQIPVPEFRLGTVAVETLHFVYGGGFPDESAGHMVAGGEPALWPTTGHRVRSHGQAGVSTLLPDGVQAPAPDDG